MNLKRIKELVKEAGGEFWQRMESDGVVNPEAFVTFDPPQSLEKFAELIVQECCDVLHDNEMGGYQVNYVLKEHFGVEE